MPRVFSKTQILEQSKKEHERLEQLLATLTPEQMEAAGVEWTWSVKDVLMHLYEWEQMVMRWLSASQRGETPCVPAEGYKWNQLPALNQHIYEKYHDLPLPEALEKFQASYRQVTAVIEGLSEEELFTPGRYPWMNQNALASYFASCTSSHYVWAIKEIKKKVK